MHNLSNKKAEPQEKHLNISEFRQKLSADSLREILPGLLIAAIIGVAAYYTTKIFTTPLIDPLLVAMVIGIAIGSFMNKNKMLAPGFLLAPKVFIPIGVIFYGAVNLNFKKFAKIDLEYLVLTMIIVLVYFGVIILLGKILKQKKQITYLTATGSAICGASAIAITSEAVDAEADDISISLLSVFIAAIFALFIFFPFISSLFDINGQVFAFLAGSVLQFTGFVKAAAGDLGKEMLSFATSIKAARYLGLLIALPLFGSLIRKKIYLPWFLWAFLGAGLVFTFFSSMALLTPSFKILQVIFWSIAMAAIGVNTKIQVLLSSNGIKALIMAFAGFFAATAAFLVGVYFINFI